MATIVDNVNGTTLQAAFDAANLAINNLWSTTAENYLSAFFAETPSIVVVGTGRIVLRSGVAEESDCYLVINGSDMAYDLNNGFRGSVSSATLYQNATATGSGASTAISGDKVVTAVLTAGQYDLNVFPAGSTVASQTVVIKGTLPTTTSALSNLLGYDVNSGVEVTRDGTFALSSMTVTDSLGDKIEWTSTGFSVTVPAAATGVGGHGYKVTLAGLGGISLTTEQMNLLASGSPSFETVFTQKLTGLTFIDTTDNVTLAEVTGITGLTLGKALSVLDKNTLPSLFTSSDTFDASGAGTGVDFNFGRPLPGVGGEIGVGQITGSAYNDHLTGGTGSDTIIGGAGNDVLAAQAAGGQNLSFKKLWSDGGIQGANTMRVTNDGRYMFILAADSRFQDGATLSSDTGDGYYTNSWNLYRVDIGTGATSGKVLKVNAGQFTGSMNQYDVAPDGKSMAYFDQYGTLHLAILDDTGIANSTATITGANSYSGVSTRYYNGGYDVFYASGSNVYCKTFNSSGILQSTNTIYTGGSYVNSFVVSADGHTAAVRDSAGHFVIASEGNPAQSHAIGANNGMIQGVSNDGRYVLYMDWSSGERNAIHVYDMTSGADLLAGKEWAQRVSWSGGSLGSDANGNVYVSFAVENLGDGDYLQTYRYELTHGTMQLLSANPNGSSFGNAWLHATSANGQYTIMVGNNDNLDSLAVATYNTAVAAPGSTSVDKLIGGAGSDTLIGGAGEDRFIYMAATDGGDVIQNFTAGKDKIVLSWNSGLAGTPTVYSTFEAGDAANPSGAFLWNQGNTLRYVPASHPNGASDAVIIALTVGYSVTTGDVITGQSVASSGPTINLDTLAQSGVLNAVSTSTTTGTNFTGSVASVNSGATVTGNAGIDTLSLNDAEVNVSGMTLSSIEVLRATNTAGATITVAPGQLATPGSVVSIIGNTGTDTLVTSGAALNLTGTGLSSIEVLKAGSAADTVFTVDTVDLVTNGSVVGNAGTDTLVVKSSTIDLSKTSLSGVEVLATSVTSAAVTYTVNQADLAAGGTITGTTATTDTVQTADTALDLSNTTLTSVEQLKANSTTATTFTVDAGDLASLRSIFGNTGVDTLVGVDTTVDLGGTTTLSGIEVIKAGNTGNTTIIVDNADLVTNGSVIGNAGIDTLAAAGTALSLGNVGLSSIEVLKVNTTANTTITVDQLDLASGGSVIGNTGVDTLAAAGTTLSLTATTLSDIEVIKAGVAGTAGATGTTFTVDQADLASGGSVVGNAGIDTLVTAGGTLNLSATTLSGVEVLKAGTTGATTFTVDSNDLASSGSVVGNAGVDTLVVNSAAISLTSTTLTSVEVIQAGTTGATTFTVDANDLASGGSVVGNAGTDTLVVNNTAITLTSTTLSSVEVIKAGTAGTAGSTGTTFTVDQNDLASGGSVIGNAGIDTLTSASTTLDLSATALSSIEVLKAGNTGATTFTVDTNDLATNGSVVGNSGIDTLVVNSATISLTSTTLTNVEVIQAGTTGATTFTVDANDLLSGGSVVGNSGTDTLVVNNTAITLAATTLSSVEVIKAGMNGTAGSVGTTFTVDANDLASGGSVVGNAGIDTLAAAGATLDLSATTLSSVEVLKAGTNGATTFTVDQADLNVARSVVGGTGIDTLAASANETALDLSAVTLTGVEVVKITNAAGTAITASTANLAAGGSVIGGTGTDTLVATNAAVDLTNLTLSGVEVIKANASGTTFNVDAADLMSGGSVVGSSGTDTLSVRDAAIDLSGTTVTGVEVLKAGTSGATAFTLDQTDLMENGTIIGTAGVDTLVAAGNTLNLTSTTVSGIEVIKVGTSANTVLSINASDLAANGTLTGNVGTDTLVIAGAGMDMTTMRVSGIEVVNASGATGAIVVAGGAGAQTLSGNGQTTYIFNGPTDSGDIVTNFSGTDKLLIAGTEWGLVAGDAWSAGSGTPHAYLAFNGESLEYVDANGAHTTIVTTTGHTLTLADVTVRTIEKTATSATYSITGETIPVDVLKAYNASTATTFTANAGNLSPYASIIGSSGTDTLQMNSTVADFSHMTLSSLETLKAMSASSSTFTVSQENLGLGALRNVTGNTGLDTLVTASSTMDLSNTAVTSFETLKAGTGTATVFTVDQADLATNGSVVGSAGTDTLVAVGTGLDLRQTSLSSIEVLKAGNAGATTFQVDQGDLASGGSVIGNAGVDTLTVTEANVDLTGTTLVGVEVLKSAATGTSVFTVDQADLDVAGSVIGSGGTNTLVISGTTLNLSNVTLSSIEVLKANNTAATTFTVDQSDLISGGSVVGNAGIDTLVVGAAAVDLSGTTLSSIEVVRAGTGSATTIKLASATGIETLAGGAGSDTLIATNATLNLASTALSSIEVLKAGLTGTTPNTTFTVDQGDLTVLQSVVGSTGVDTIVVNDTVADLSGTVFSGVEVIKAGASVGTTLTVAQANLATSGTVIGTGSANDTLIVAGTSLDLTSTTLSGVEVLKAGTTSATTFSVDQTDLNGLTAIVGTSAGDTLVLSGAAVNLGTTALSGIEVIKQTNGGTNNTLTLTQAALMANGTVIGSAGVDTLVVGGTSIDLSATTLSSIDVLKASGTTATTFTVAQSTLGGTSTVIGSVGTDTLVVASSAVDLTSTTLSGIEVIKAGTRAATTFLVNQAALAANGSVIGTNGTDTLVSAGTSLDLRQTTLTSVEVIKAGTGSATTFTVDQADLLAGSKIIGARGVDTLVAAGTSLDLRQVTLSSVEVIKAGAAGATTFTVDQNDLAANGTVVGGSGTDTLVVNNATINLGTTTLSSVEVIKAGLAGDTVFNLTQASLATNGSLIGSAGTDTVVASAATLNLANTSLSGIEVIKAGLTTDTSLTLAQANLKSGGSVIGSAGTDTLTVTGASLDLTATTVSGVEVIKAGGTAATTFTVNQADFATGATVIGTANSDTLVVADTAIDLRDVTLTSVEVIKAGGGASSFTLDNANLTGGKTVIGTSGKDSIVIADAALNLSATTLSSVEVLRITNGGGAEVTLSQANLTAATSLVGGAGSDTLVINETSLNLTNESLTSIEVIKAGKTTATTFTVNSGDLAALTSVIGNAGIDTLAVNGTGVNLSGTTLSSVEVVKGTSTAPITFTVASDTLGANSSVVGNTGVDTLAVNGASLDLTAVTLSSIEMLKAATTAGTTFTVDAADLAANGSVVGNAGVDTLVIKGTSLSLTSTTLSGVEVLKAGTTGATTFTLDAADLTGVESLEGNAGVDTLVVNSTSIDLTGAALTSVEVIKAGTGSATTFTVNLADLAAGGSVIGSAGTDTLVMAEDVAGLVSTTLSSIETVTANGVTYTVRADSDGGLATNSLVMGTAGNNTLRVTGTGSAALMGGAGNDTYEIGNNRFNSVVIADASGTDKLDISAMTLDIEFASLSTDRHDVTLSFGGGKTITLSGQFLGQGVETLADRYQDYVVANGAQASGVNQIMVAYADADTVLTAGNGNDMVFGGGFNDTLDGGAGDDLLDGGLGDNILIGGEGNDVLTTVHAGATSVNQLSGGLGDDTYMLGGAAGNSVTIQATGGGADTYVLMDTFGAVRIDNSVRAEGGVLDLSRQISADPTGFARSGNDLVMEFSSGSSLLVSGQYNGTNGLAAVNNHGLTQVLSQSADNSGSTDSVLYVAGAGGQAGIKGSQAGNDILVGGSGVDTILGSAAGNSTLIGGDGGDTITADGSDNTVVGGDGADTLTAGSGATVFWYNSTSEVGDTINGFASGDDRIAVYSPNFAGLTVGTLSSANFALGTTATAAAAQFLFDSATSQLRFDADGTGAGVAVTIATLTGVSSLNSNDILVVNKSVGQNPAMPI